MTTALPVSIVIPCYNAAATLAATLASAIPENPAQIIIIDDGSRDDTLAIARAHEPAVSVISGPNRGASLARNTGIAAACEPWIVFLDADDFLTPGTLAQRIGTAHATRADVVACDWEDVIDDGAGALTPGARHCADWAALEADAERAIAAHVWVTTAALLYDRALVSRIGGFRADLPVIQDARFMFDAAFHGGRFAHAAHVGARYRVVAGSLSRRDPAAFWADVLRNGAQIEALWRARGLDAARRKVIAGIYDTASRGLLRAADPRFFEAAARQRGLREPLPLHSRIAHPLARAVGLRAAHALLAGLGRA